MREKNGLSAKIAKELGISRPLIIALLTLVVAIVVAINQNTKK
ncbi:hypothetical protein [Paenibacillus senegalimassiliensis]|nr:hypothetical protein [Paenibacillus senegalimassiliensis]